MTPADQVVHVGPSFRVNVTDGSGRAVRGLSIEINSSAGKSTAVTDEDGVVSFRDVGPGLYSLRAEQDVGGGMGKVLEVQPGGSPGVAVPITWPSAAPVMVRSLKGTLHVPNYIPGQPGPKLDLTLLSGISGQPLSSVQTSETGDFDFEIAAPGTYFLNLKLSAPKGWHGVPIAGRVPVSVEADAPSDGLDLELGSTDCGLTWTDLIPCPPVELQLGQLRGKVIGPAGSYVVTGGEVLRHNPPPVDPTGPAVPGAEILLMGPGGNFVERLTSDRSGGFASKQALAGPYDLLVRSFGFKTFRARVRITPDASLPAWLNIQFGDWKDCSSAHLQ